MSKSDQEDIISKSIDVLKILADETRWQLLRELRWGDLAAGDLAVRLGQPQNLISYHLGLLRQAGFVVTHRSNADARIVYYGIDLTVVHGAYQALGHDLHLGTPYLHQPPAGLRVVFVCSHNSARSQMAEGWLRHLSEGRILVRSAGTEPAALHPLAIKVMQEAGIDIGHQRSKTLDELSTLAPHVAVTVCDRAREQCYPCLEAPLQLHWSIADPAGDLGNAAEQRALFQSVRDELRVRVEGLLHLLPSVQRLHLSVD